MLKALARGPSDLSTRRAEECNLELLPYLKLSSALVEDCFANHTCLSIILDEACSCFFLNEVSAGGLLAGLGSVALGPTQPQAKLSGPG